MKTDESFFRAVPAIAAADGSAVVLFSVDKQLERLVGAEEARRIAALLTRAADHADKLVALATIDPKSRSLLIAVAAGQA